MAHCRYGCKPSTYSGGYCWNSSSHPSGRGEVLVMKHVGFTRSEYREFLDVQHRAPVGSIVRCPVIMEKRGDIVISVCGVQLHKPEGDGIVMCVPHQNEAHEAMHREV